MKEHPTVVNIDTLTISFCTLDLTVTSCIDNKTLTSLSPFISTYGAMVYGSTCYQVSFLEQSNLSGMCEIDQIVIAVRFPW